VRLADWADGAIGLCRLSFITSMATAKTTGSRTYFCSAPTVTARPIRGERATKGSAAEPLVSVAGFRIHEFGRLLGEAGGDRRQLVG
jgi:hypothetical protein